MIIIIILCEIIWFKKVKFLSLDIIKKCLFLV